MHKKGEKYKPNFATENLCDLELDSNQNKLIKSIKGIKNNNDDVNLFEISKNISGNEIKNFFNSLCNETKETQDNLYDNIVNNAKTELDDYLQIFDVQFEEALKQSIFEYNTKYIAYIYRRDEQYNKDQKRCKNIEKKILFHGTNSISISRILGDKFNESKVHIFGPGFYFSDSLDYTWYYVDDSEKIGSRENFNKIPEINKTFSFIVANIYYDKDKFEQVYNNSTKDIPVPEFGIRHVLVYYDSSVIPKYKLKNYTKFKGTEYLVTNWNQILPLLSVTVERVKYLIVWRDNNFNTSNPNGYSQFENILEYNNEIKNYASFNLKTKIYFFNESNEALKFIKRKKYNKIILITNGGNNGDEFIKNARKIIGKNTMALITCFVAKNYLKIVKDIENVLLTSTDFNCMKKFLSLACDENSEELKNLQKEAENIYKEFDKSFEFKKINENAFRFPKFKENGKFEELYFEDDDDDHCLIV